MTKKHMKKCSASLAIKEILIKTTLRFYLPLIRMAIVKNTNNNFAFEARLSRGKYTVPGDALLGLGLYASYYWSSI
jgi:hypothetical protein